MDRDRAPMDPRFEKMSKAELLAELERLQATLRENKELQEALHELSVHQEEVRIQKQHRSVFLNHLRRCRAGESLPVPEVHIRARDGNVLPVQLSITPGPQGKE